MIAVIAKAGFVTPMDFGFFFFGFLLDCRVNKLQSPKNGLSLSPNLF